MQVDAQGSVYFGLTMYFYNCPLLLLLTTAFIFAAFVYISLLTRLVKRNSLFSSAIEINTPRTFLKLCRTLTARVLSSLKNNLVSCVLEFQINFDQTLLFSIFQVNILWISQPQKKWTKKRKVDGNLDYELQVEIFMPFAINPKRDSKFL